MPPEELEELENLIGDTPVLDAVGAIFLVGSVALGLSSLIRRDDGGTNPATEAALSEQHETIRSLEEKRKQAEQRNRAFLEKRNAEAREYLDEAERNLSEIRNLRWALFLPQGIQPLENALNGAKKIAREGNPAALSTAYAVWSQILQVNEKLLEMERAWEAEMEEMLSAQARLLPLLSQCHALPVRIRTPEGTQDIHLDVDYWTRGRAERLRGEIPERVPRRDTAMDELKRQRENLVRAEDEWKALQDTAFQLFQDCQERMRLCESIYASLIRRRWILSGADACAFEDGDDRNALFLKMKNESEDFIEFRFPPRAPCNVNCSFHGGGSQALITFLLRALRDDLIKDGFSEIHFNDLA